MIELVEKKDIETLKQTLQNVMANNVGLELRIANLEKQLKALTHRVGQLEFEVKTKQFQIPPVVPSTPYGPYTPGYPSPGTPSPNTIWCNSEYKYTNNSVDK